jgi:hypothetical protein
LRFRWAMRQKSTSPSSSQRHRRRRHARFPRATRTISCWRPRPGCARQGPLTRTIASRLGTPQTARSEWRRRSGRRRRRWTSGLPRRESSATDRPGRAQRQRSSHARTTWSRDSSCPKAAASRAGEGGRRSAVGPADPRVQPEHRQRTHDDLDARSIPARGPEGTSTTDWHGHGAA